MILNAFLSGFTSLVLAGELDARGSMLTSFLQAFAKATGQRPTWEAFKAYLHIISPQLMQKELGSLLHKFCLKLIREESGYEGYLYQEAIFDFVSAEFLYFFQHGQPRTTKFYALTSIRISFNKFKNEFFDLPPAEIRSQLHDWWQEDDVDSGYSYYLKDLQRAKPWMSQCELVVLAEYFGISIDIKQHNGDNESLYFYNGLLMQSDVNFSNKEINNLVWRNVLDAEVLPGKYYRWHPMRNEEDFLKKISGVRGCKLFLDYIDKLPKQPLKGKVVSTTNLLFLKLLREHKIIITLNRKKPDEVSLFVVDFAVAKEKINSLFLLPKQRRALLDSIEFQIEDVYLKPLPTELVANIDILELSNRGLVRLNRDKTHYEICQRIGKLKDRADDMLDKEEMLAYWKLTYQETNLVTLESSNPNHWKCCLAGEIAPVKELSVPTLSPTLSFFEVSPEKPVSPIAFPAENMSRKRKNCDIADANAEEFARSCFAKVK